jgi:hypothetical protein
MLGNQESRNGGNVVRIKPSGEILVHCNAPLGDRRLVECRQQFTLASSPKMGNCPQTVSVQGCYIALQQLFSSRGLNVPVCPPCSAARQSTFVRFSDALSSL